MNEPLYYELYVSTFSRTRRALEQGGDAELEEVASDIGALSGSARLIAALANLDALATGVARSRDAVSAVTDLIVGNGPEPTQQE